MAVVEADDKSAVFAQVKKLIDESIQAVAKNRIESQQ